GVLRPLQGRGQLPRRRRHLHQANRHLHLQDAQHPSDSGALRGPPRRELGTCASCAARPYCASLSTNVRTVTVNTHLRPIPSHRTRESTSQGTAIMNLPYRALYVLGLLFVLCISLPRSAAPEAA